MKLNHLDLQVTDVQSTVTFFETFFGLVLQTSRHTPAIAILSDGEGFVLVLQKRTDDRPWPDGFHLGFLVDDTETVLHTRQRLADAGHAVSEPSTNNRGMQVYCRMPDGYLVEVSCRKTAPTH